MQIFANISFWNPEHFVFWDKFWEFKKFGINYLGFGI